MLSTRASASFSATTRAELEPVRADEDRREVDDQLRVFALDVGLQRPDRVELDLVRRDLAAAGEIRAVGRLGEIALRLPLHLDRAAQLRRGRAGRISARELRACRAVRRALTATVTGPLLVLVLETSVVVRADGALLRAVDLVRRAGSWRMAAASILAALRRLLPALPARAQQRLERAEVRQVDVQVRLIVERRDGGRLPVDVEVFLSLTGSGRS